MLRYEYRNGNHVSAVSEATKSSKVMIKDNQFQVRVLFPSPLPFVERMITSMTVDVPLEQVLGALQGHMPARSKLDLEVDLANVKGMVQMIHERCKDVEARQEKHREYIRLQIDSSYGTLLDVIDDVNHGLEELIEDVDRHEKIIGTSLVVVVSRVLRWLFGRWIRPKALKVLSEADDVMIEVEQADKLERRAKAITEAKGPQMKG